MGQAIAEGIELGITQLLILAIDRQCLGCQCHLTLESGNQIRFAVQGLGRLVPWPLGQGMIGVGQVNVP
ncbi:hypothetical protein D3C81_2290630 [compost metagenome]